MTGGTVKNEARGSRRRTAIVGLSVGLVFAVGGAVLDSTYGPINNLLYACIYSVALVLAWLWSERRAARNNRKQ